MKKSVLFCCLLTSVVMLAGCAAGGDSGLSDAVLYPAQSGGADIETQKMAIEDALNVALKHAGLSADTVNFTKSKLEFDDGIWEYDIEFTANSIEYEYTINAVSGEIVEFSSEKIAAHGGTDSESGLNSSLQTVEHITEEQTIAIALNHAGLTTNTVKLTKSKLNLDDGVWEYEIEFITSSFEYEYIINAVSGEVIEFSSEKINSQGGSGSNSGSQAGEQINEEQARYVALKHANLAANSVNFTKVKLEQDDGVWEYKIEFTAKGVEYEYTINAVSGEVIEFSSKKIGSHGGTGSGNSSNSSSQTAGHISAEQAKTIALNHAGFTASVINFTKSKLDFDDGVWEYEIEFTVNGVEYEYTINAVSGDIIEFSSEKIGSHGGSGSGNSSNSGSQSADRISEEQAKIIALNHAGLTTNTVNLTKSKLDFDDGVWEYEIEFIANSVEYEYTINAVSGEIIEFSTEKIT